jgi:hypothetical protein
VNQSFGKQIVVTSLNVPSHPFPTIINPIQYYISTLVQVEIGTIQHGMIFKTLCPKVNVLKSGCFLPKQVLLDPPKELKGAVLVELQRLNGIGIGIVIVNIHGSNDAYFVAVAIVPLKNAVAGQSKSILMIADSLTS